MRYTIGSGCSGGSLAQQQVANAYPGVYQGITPACSFTDAWSSAMQYVDYQLLRRYFENPARWAPGRRLGAGRDRRGRGPPEPGQRDHLHHGDPARAATRAAAARACPREQVYDATTNPKGVRCSLQDYMVNVFGRRAQDGFARPARRQRRHRVRAQGAAGGHDHAGPVRRPQRQARRRATSTTTRPRARAAADRPALERVYRSGAVNQADQPRQGRDHRPARPRPRRLPRRLPHLRDARAARARARHGRQPGALARPGARCSATPTSPTQAIVAMDRWLAAVETRQARRPARAQDHRGQARRR